MDREYVCVVCGEIYKGYKADPSGMCRRCRRHPHYHGADYHTKKRRKKVTPLSEVAAAAHAMGLTYGQYVARGLDR